MDFFTILARQTSDGGYDVPPAESTYIPGPIDSVISSDDGARSTWSSLPSPSTLWTVPSMVPSRPTPTRHIVQYFDEDPNYYEFDVSQLDSVPWDKLCLGGDCIAACEDTTRVFEPLPDQIDADLDEYGNPLGVIKHIDLTFFGLCSNLETAWLMASEELSPEKSSMYFPGELLSSEGQVNTTAERISDVSSTIAGCLSATCNVVRNSSNCDPYCSPGSLLTPGEFTTYLDPTNTFNCMLQLCSSTCGLPYADADAFGAGVSQMDTLPPDQP